MGKFIHIRSNKFPILPGEEKELINKETYGKALAQYLQGKLIERGYDAPFTCCEDWGWWVELRTAPFAFGVCIRCGAKEDGPSEYVCTDNADGRNKWSWKKLRFFDPSPWVDKLHEDLVTILRAEKDVQIINKSDDFPLGFEAD